jgi:hypothetical protein
VIQVVRRDLLFLLSITINMIMSGCLGPGLLLGSFNFNLLRLKRGMAIFLLRISFVLKVGSPGYL